MKLIYWIRQYVSCPLIQPDSYTTRASSAPAFLPSCMTALVSPLCASPPYAQAPRRVLRAVTCLILSILPSFFVVAQAPRGVLRAVTCHERGACARKGRVLSRMTALSPHLRREVTGLPRCLPSEGSPGADRVSGTDSVTDSSPEDRSRPARRRPRAVAKVHPSPS